jgi:dolichol-phosphate mannosyltransferase
MIEDMLDISIVMPMYNEVDNLPSLQERLFKVMEQTDLRWEWLIVDDHSTDKTFLELEKISAKNPHVKVIRLSRNFGSHAAILCGLEYCRSRSAVVMASDLQDPPEIIPQLVEKWQGGSDTVWAERGLREGVSPLSVGLARMFYILIRNFAGVRAMPPRGADFFLIDRKIINDLMTFREKNVHLMALIAWLGYKQESITYTKEARLHGETGWSLGQKIKLAVDAITSFTYLPIRLISLSGAVLALVGFLYGLIVFFTAFITETPPGWVSLMVVFLLVSGFQMIMLGVLGEYLWRALDESRARPRYLVEKLLNVSDQARPGP